MIDFTAWSSCWAALACWLLAGSLYQHPGRQTWPMRASVIGAFLAGAWCVACLLTDRSGAFASVCMGFGAVAFLSWVLLRYRYWLNGAGEHRRIGWSAVVSVGATAGLVAVGLICQYWVSSVIMQARQEHLHAIAAAVGRLWLSSGSPSGDMHASSREEVVEALKTWLDRDPRYVIGCRPISGSGSELSTLWFEPAGKPQSRTPALSRMYAGVLHEVTDRKDTPILKVDVRFVPSVDREMTHPITAIIAMTGCAVLLLWWFIWFRSKPQRQTRPARRREMVGALLVGGVTTLIAAHSTRCVNAYTAQSLFNRRAASSFLELQDEVWDIQQAYLQYLATFYAASESVTPEEFRIFASGAFHNLSVQAIGWAPDEPGAPALSVPQGWESIMMQVARSGSDVRLAKLPVAMRSVHAQSPGPAGKAIVVIDLPALTRAATDRWIDTASEPLDGYDAGSLSEQTFTLTLPLLIGSRPYWVRMSPTLASVPSTASVYVVFVCGLLLSTCAAALLYVYVNRRTMMEQMLAERTHDLQSSREWMSATLRSIGDGVIATDMQGRVQQMNGVAERLTGWTEQLAHQLPIEQVFCIENAFTSQAVHNPVREVLQSGQMVSLANHTILVSLGGERYHIADSAAPIKLPSGEFAGVVLVFRDVTQAYQLNEQIRASELRFRTLFSHMNEGVALHELVFDSAMVPVDYRLVEVNDRYQQILGVDRDMVVGRLATEVYQTDEAPYLDVYARVALTGQPQTVDVYFEPMKRHFHVSVAPWGEHGFATIFTDITEQKETIQQLERSESRLRLLMQNLPTVVFSIDRDGLFTLLEGAGLARVGLKPGELVGQSALDLYADYPDIVAALQMALAGAPSHSRSEVDGVTFDIWYAPIRDADGNLDGAMGIAYDVTEQVAHEAERRQMEARMLQVQKLESMGVLAGGIAHDFNNLLMAILGRADLARRKLPPLSPARDGIEEIIKATQRASDLCRQMLAYSGRSRFQLVCLDLRDLIEETLHLLELAISKKAILNLILEPNLPPIEGDPSQLNQVLMNLVINASEAIGDRSGVITLRTGAQMCTREYLRETYLDENLKEGLYVCLEVSDNGCGMDAETRQRLFDPFFTTKFTGRGLGLAAVLGIVRAHRGAIKVYSELNKGTTFKVLFPACEAAQVPTTESSGAKPQLKGEGRTVLLVDDEETIRAVGQQMLETLGFQVLVAADGREGLEILKTHKSSIALILLDLTMPHMNGEEAFREVRLLAPEIPVMLTSGYSEHEVTTRFAGKGLAGFIQKPYTLELLIERIAAVLQPET